MQKSKHRILKKYVCDCAAKIQRAWRRYKVRKIIVPKATASHFQVKTKVSRSS